MPATARETLLEGTMKVAFLGKEGKDSKKNHQNDVRFPLYGICPGKILCMYAFASNPHTFSDRQNTSKTVDLCMVMGMDVKLRT